MRVYTSENIEYPTKSGVIKRLQPVSKTNRQFLEEYLKKLYTLLDDLPSNVTFQEALRDSSDVEHYSRAALESAGVDWDDCTPILIEKLLLPSEQSSLGFVVDLNFKGIKDKPQLSECEGQEGVSGADLYYQSMASLWLILGNLKEAVEIMDSLPSPVVDKLIEESIRIRKESTETIADKQKRQAMKDLEKMKQDAKFPV